MHDIKFIRENPEAFDAALARRGLAALSPTLIALDTERRNYETLFQNAQAKRNQAAKAIGQAKASGNHALFEELREKASLEKSLEDSFVELGAKKASELQAALAVIPNLPAGDVPYGEDETDNVEVRRWGTPRIFNFTPQEHADLGPSLGLDFETGALLSGARFTFLRGQIARLHRSIAQFMLDEHTAKNGYVECNPPVLVNDAAMYGTDKLPKFAEDSFQTHINFKSFISDLIDDAVVNAQEVIEDEKYSSLSVAEKASAIAIARTAAVERWTLQLREMGVESGLTRRWLIPTSEVSLTASVSDKIIELLASPIRLTAHSLCFRSEAGAAGKDTRGFIRQHQFEKVELVSICKPQDSEAEHERMTGAAESILQALELPYRKVLLCTGDMGFGARKTYDLEVWLPGQDTFREISSCSNCGDFQARRMNTRFRPEGGKGTEFVHTLNGSGLAVGRTLVAVLENYQQEDGSVTVPEALLPYMGGIDRLVPA